MTSPQVRSRELSFQLFDVLDTAGLVCRTRYREHSPETLRSVVETFCRLSEGKSGLGNDQLEGLADGSVGIVPEVVLTLGNGLYQAAGQRSRLFRTRSEDLLAEPFLHALTAWQCFRRNVAEVAHEKLDDAVVVDQRRRLLAAKSRSEGGLALCLFAASLSEDQNSHPEAERRQQAQRLLEFIEPVIAWWPVQAALETRLQSGAPDDDFPGRASLDRAAALARELLGQRVWQHQSHGLQLFLKTLQADLEASTTNDTRQWALSLSETLQRAVKVTQALGQGLQQGQADRVLANAMRYLHLFGEMMAAWMWLRQANAAARLLPDAPPQEQPFYRGKLQAARFCFHWQLPEVAQDLVLLQNQDSTCLDMRAGWF